MTCELFGLLTIPASGPCWLIEQISKRDWACSGSRSAVRLPVCQGYMYPVSVRKKRGKVSGAHAPISAPLWICPNQRAIRSGRTCRPSARVRSRRERCTRLTTDKMDQYRKKRKDGGVMDATVNRELSILRTAFHNGRKRTPAKVNIVPYFPMVKETTVRQGFLSDEKYERLRDELPHELKPLFVCDYKHGIRKSELLAIQWPQVDFKAGLITLSKGETKGKDARTCPILNGDMHDLLWAAFQERQKNWPKSPWVFNRSGKQIKSFRGAWKSACQRAGVSDLHLHDMRRTAVRNMRDAGVPQSIRMQISGHKTDSMERRYSIVDREDIVIAKALMEKRVRRSEIVPEIVPTLG